MEKLTASETFGRRLREVRQRYAITPCYSRPPA